MTLLMPDGTALLYSHIESIRVNGSALVIRMSSGKEHPHSYPDEDTAKRSRDALFAAMGHGGNTIL